MWDFSIGRTLGIMATTWPFIPLRLVVYFGITVAYVVAPVAGAGVGYGVGPIPASPGSFALWGGHAGSGPVAPVVFWFREYLP